MKRSLLILASVLAILIGGGVIWNELRQLNPGSATPQNSTSTAANATAAAPPVAHVTAVPHLNQILFKHVIAQKVDDLVHAAQYQEPEAVAANELTLPRAALPLLVEQSSRKDLSPPTIKAIKDALEADKPRVDLAMKEKKKLDWYYNNTLAVFDKLNASNPNGRQLARSAIGAAVRRWAHDPGTTGDENISMWNHAHHAAEAGSNDALLFFVRAQNLFDYRSEKNLVLKPALQAEKLMEAGKYPAYYQLATALFAAQCISDKDSKTDADQQEITRLLTRCRDLYTQVFADPDVPLDAWLNLYYWIGGASVEIYGDRRKLAAQYFDQLDKSKVDRSIVLTVKGIFNSVYSTEVPAMATQDDRTIEYYKRLNKAEAALSQAWALDHSNVTAATSMISTESALGNGREAAELWFTRAVAADPQYIHAYELKFSHIILTYGDRGELIDFARKASQSAPPDSQVRLLIVSAQMTASRFVNSQEQDEMSPDYFHNNSQAWADIHQAYMDYLPFHPESHHAHLRYAQLSGWCGHWDEANRMFKELPPETYDNEVFFKMEDQDKFAARAAAEALHPSTMP